MPLVKLFEVDVGMSVEQYRLAIAADIPRIVTLVNAASSGDGGTAGWTNEAHLFHGNRTDEAEIGQLWAAPGALFVLAMCEGRIIGCAYLNGMARDAYLGLLSVAPLWQGRGLGSQLIAECERIASEELECKRLRITVITSHRPEVTAFYERRGFVRTGEFKPFDRRQALEGKKVDGMRLEWMKKTLSEPAISKVRTPFMSLLVGRSPQGENA